MKADKKVVKSAFKATGQAVCLALAFPAAALCGFGRSEPLFLMFAHFYAIIPGLPGDYFRIAFYRLTLRECSLLSRVSFGTFFAHTDSSIASEVYIGPYCVLGKVNIGRRTQIASSVQVLSGRHQHARTTEGQISSSRDDDFVVVTIGADCWIGAAAIVMADVGDGSTVGAGSVVVQPIPPHSVAVGNPARVIRSNAGLARTES